MRSQTLLPPHHRRPQHSFGVVVRGLDSFHLAKGPQSDSIAKAHGRTGPPVGPVSGCACSQKPSHFSAHRHQKPSQRPAADFPLAELLPQVKYSCTNRQSRISNLCARTFLLGQVAKIPLEVRPAQAATREWNLFIHPKALPCRSSLDLPSQQLVHRSPGCRGGPDDSAVQDRVAAADRNFPAASIMSRPRSWPTPSESASFAGDDTAQSTPETSPDGRAIDPDPDARGGNVDLFSNAAPPSKFHAPVKTQTEPSH